MSAFSLVPFAATALAVLLAVGSLARKKRSFATWCFFAGMLVLAGEALCTGLGLRSDGLAAEASWLTRAFIVGSLVPAPWLGFALSYSRADSRALRRPWGVVALALALVPVAASLIFRDRLLQIVLPETGELLLLRFGIAARAVNVFLLLAYVLVLMTLEQTLRAAVGTMRWRIKFVVLGLAVIFGARVYGRALSVLFGAPALAWLTVESTAVLIGCLLLAVAYLRSGLAEVDVYPSRAVLQSSVTVLLVGTYLFVVGVLAQVAQHVGGTASFQLQALVVLAGVSGLAVLLLSDRLRYRLNRFLGRHFSKAQHDSVRIWAACSRQLADVKSEAGLCAACSKLVADSFDVLSISVWLMDEQTGRFVLEGTTSPRTESGSIVEMSEDVAAVLRGRSSPFCVEDAEGAWGAEIRQLHARCFPSGGDRWCVPMRACERTVGALVLADRVDGAPYTAEELELLQCIGEQAASTLLGLRLANEVSRSRELEAFRTMSAFFVHDLKNTAASFNLLLTNLRAHFDDPAFRGDAIRTLANTAARIDDIVARLGSVRQHAEFRPAESDLNQLLSETLDGMDEMPDVALTRELHPLPKVLADREQLRSVVTNLVLNARDAVEPGGRIHVRTEHRDGHIVLSVTDNGCGMSPSFMKDSLFRPFQTTKKRGLGIGMFQSRMIVEAHGGTIGVESERGKGTTFRVSLPAEH